ncbi:MAG: SGNH/GDSL hydrolase family protein [Lachnospiraceae bacterium]|nr:SGNH/GDSL hydrolase family protein [Lachnospiraceae bacterium]
MAKEKINKKTKKMIPLIIAGAIVFILLAAVILICFVIPSVREKKLREEAEELRVELEKEHNALLNSDLEKIMNEEYDGIFLAMTDSEGWSEDLFAGYLGLDVYKADSVYENSEELMSAWKAAVTSGNDIKLCVLILDPFKLYEVAQEKDKKGNVISTEYSLNTDYKNICDDLEDAEFRIYMPFYPIKYWEDNYTEETFRLAMAAYRDVLSSLIKCENVNLFCFTGYDWLVENKNLFNDNNGLIAKASEVMFLYGYKNEWQVENDNVVDIVKNMETNLSFPDPEVEPAHWWDPLAELFAPTQEVVEEEAYKYQGLENCDVVFWGDSVFELSDGPYSVPSYFALMTGARVYNISKGGLSAAKYVEEYITCPDMVDFFLNKKPTGLEGYEVMDRDIKRFWEDDHTDRKILFITDFGVNDYMYGAPITGEDVDSYEGAMRVYFDSIREAFPDCSFVNLGLYYMSFLGNGTVVNEVGKYYRDYKDLLIKLSAEYGCGYIDLEKESVIDSTNVGRYLEDGLHPAIPGAMEVSRVLAENLTK